MIITAEQLANQISQGLKSVYVICGDEPLSVRESLDLLRQKAKSLNCDERIIYSVDRSFNWSVLDHFSQSMSLFSSKRLLEINIPSGKPGIEGSKSLQALLAQPPEDTFTIITLPQVDWKEAKSAWFKALQDQAVFIQVHEVPAQQLPHWIEKRLALQNQSTDKDTLIFMANQVEGNLLAAHQEIQKLGLLYPEGVLSGDQVKVAVLNVSRFDSVMLTESVLLGDVSRTVRIIEGLKDEGVAAVPVINALLWVISPLLKVKEAQAKGRSLEQSLVEAKLFGPKQVVAKKALARLSLKQLQAALLRLADIDKTAKGIIHGDAWLEITRLCFGLARITPSARRH
jgi:DNA polymerase III subunit delta